MSKLYGVPQNHRVILEELGEIEDQLEAETSQQLTGSNYFFYYGTVVFNGAGIKNTYTQMILGVVNFGTTFGLYVTEHFGRRKSLITWGIWIFVCFMVFASVGHFSLNVHDFPQKPGAGKAMVVFACLLIT
ncbi:hexose transporter hxt1 [Aspergillus viridinutans]|uniref:Hexose transporter hxt1 n=1 Tax=Aspergillus viridinutans TaxID=75553 RepID=A0A9P3F3J3_ASPVI|nr:hexose transporter hxt1 [Aspergillus viridinutans]GIK04152.1 hexose transporter hxt1 [Aspergillus viridinutans]